MAPEDLLPVPPGRHRAQPDRDGPSDARVPSARHAHLATAESPLVGADAARPGKGAPIATVIDRRPSRPRRRWRDLPRPGRATLLGAALLALVAGGAVHLSSTGSAVPVLAADADPSASSASVPIEPTSPVAPSTLPSSGGRPSDPATPATILVHVTGAVAEPGVVELPSGARVDDAVTAAGGATDEADLAAVNLARPAVDGEQIHVPVPGEPAPSVPPAPAPTSSGGGEKAAGPGGGTGLIDINTADATALDELPGVGPAIAQRIIDHREANGPFASVDDLEQVPGIGPATVDKLRDRATV